MRRKAEKEGFGGLAPSIWNFGNDLQKPLPRARSEEIPREIQKGYNGKILEFSEKSQKQLLFPKELQEKKPGIPQEVHSPISPEASSAISTDFF